MLDACAKRGAEFSRTCFLGTRQRRDPKGKNDDNDDIIAQKLSPPPPPYWNLVSLFWKWVFY